MGATAWSDSVAAGRLEDGNAVTSDDFFSAIQQGKLWTIINEVVYDLTSYIQEHPGGVKAMEEIVGVDGTESLIEAHGDDRAVMKVLSGLVVGELDDDAGELNEHGDSHDSILPEDFNSDRIQSESRNETETSRFPSLAVTRGAPAQSEPLVSFQLGMSRKEWRSFVIEKVDELSQDVLLFRIHITGDEPIDFPMTSHLMVRGTDPTTEKNVVRCFTPLIPDQMEHTNRLDLLVKCYEDGRMSRYIRQRKVGDTLEMKGPMCGRKVEKGAHQHICLIGGGSGITPLWQVIDGLLSDPEDKTQISLLYQNRYEDDILLRFELDTLAAQHPRRFRVIYILSKPPEDWVGLSGRLNATILSEHLPRPDVPGAFIMICGPPGLNKSLAGHTDFETNEQTEGILQQLGYTNDMIHVYG